MFWSVSQDLEACSYGNDVADNDDDDDDKCCLVVCTGIHVDVRLHA